MLSELLTKKIILRKLSKTYTKKNQSFSFIFSLKVDKLFGNLITYEFYPF